MAKVHRFLKDVDDTKAKQFRAMMTDERAGQHLMQLTLGDTLLIPSTADAEQILEELESRFEQKHRAKAEAAIAEAKSNADELIRQAERDREQQAQMARDSATGELVLKGQLKDALDAVERERQESAARTKAIAHAAEKESAELRRQYLTEKRIRLEEKRSLLQECVDGAIQSTKRRIQVLAAVAGVVLFVASVLGTEYATRLAPGLSLAGAAATGIIGGLSFWRFPDLVFGTHIVNLRQRTYNDLVAQYHLGQDLSNFEVDWKKGSVSIIDLPAESPDPEGQSR